MGGSEFLKWHPSSSKSTQLQNESENVIDILIQSPSKGVSILKDKYKFGLHSQLWDDYVFNTIIRLSLEKVINSKKSNKTLKDSVDWFSALDHELFLPYIRRVEIPERFRTAFWNVNSYGQILSTRFHTNFLSTCDGHSSMQDKHDDHVGLKKILFVLKGPYKLAHVEFLNALLQGSRHFASLVEVHLLLLDANKESVRIPGVKTVSFSKTHSTFEKLVRYKYFCREQLFDSICWVACVQNLSLYMGMQNCPSQAYLSMKYHSIIMPTIQKYAGIGSSSIPFSFDGINWFRGRAFPLLNLKRQDNAFCLSAKNYFSIADSSFVIGCFVRSEKLHNLEYWQVIEKLLSEFDHVVFVFASQSIPVNIKNYLDQSIFNSRIKHVGWIDTKAWCHVLDLYLDSFPRGSGNTMFEAILARVPCLIMDTPENRESSALNYIDSFNSPQNVLGITSDIDSHLMEARKIIQSTQYAEYISANQFRVLDRLRNSTHLFAKDYLNYFLGTSFSLSGYSG